jgi:hypothetical protein
MNWYCLKEKRTWLGIPFSTYHRTWFVVVVKINTGLFGKEKESTLEWTGRNRRHMGNWEDCTNGSSELNSARTVVRSWVGQGSDPCVRSVDWRGMARAVRSTFLRSHETQLQQLRGPSNNPTVLDIVELSPKQNLTSSTYTYVYVPSRAGAANGQVRAELWPGSPQLPRWSMQRAGAGEVRCIQAALHGQPFFFYGGTSGCRSAGTPVTEYHHSIQLVSVAVRSRKRRRGAGITASF